MKLPRENESKRKKSWKEKKLLGQFAKDTDDIKNVKQNL